MSANEHNPDSDDHEPREAFYDGRSALSDDSEHDLIDLLSFIRGKGSVDPDEVEELLEEVGSGFCDETGQYTVGFSYQEYLACIQDSLSGKDAPKLGQIITVTAEVVSITSPTEEDIIVIVPEVVSCDTIEMLLREREAGTSSQTNEGGEHHG